MKNIVNWKQLGKMIKILIMVLTLVFIYIEVFHKGSFIDSISGFSVRLIEHKWLIILTILLMPVNWGLESLKWQKLLTPFQKLPLLSVFRAVMTGVSVSFFTPNRVGEFGGRILYLEPEHRSAGTMSTVLGAIAQLAVTLLGGAVSGIVFQASSPNRLDLPFSLVLLIGLALFASTLFVYFNSGKVLSWFAKKRIPEFLQNFFSAAKTYSTKDLLKALIYSIIRYAVFCTQLGIIIVAVVQFKVAPSLAELIYMIPLYFFVITLVPTIGVTEVATRGVILASLFNQEIANTDLIFAGMLIWFINIIIPAVVGMISIWTIRIKFKRP